MIKHIVSWLFSKVVSEKGDIMSEKRRYKKNRILRTGRARMRNDAIDISILMVNANQFTVGGW